MSSALKNFILTFLICLAVFGFIGYSVYPSLVAMLDFHDMGDNNSSDTQSEVSQEVSETESEPENKNPNFDEDGDVFTAVVMCVDSYGRAVDTVFIDANGKTKQYVYCPIPSSVKRTNAVGVTAPVGDLFSMMSADEVCQMVTAMTGIETQYCIRFDRDDISAVSAQIPGANIVLPDKDGITFINPEFKDFVPDDGVTYPDNYYITITNNGDGKVLLNEKNNGKTNLEWLLSYTPNADGSEYNAYYSLICKSLIRQFFQNEGSTMSTNVMSAILRNSDTNMSTSDATDHLSTIFAYNDYKRHEYTYPSNWGSAVKDIREMDDGSYKK